MHLRHTHDKMPDASRDDPRSPRGHRPLARLGRTEGSVPTLHTVDTPTIAPSRVAVVPPLPPPPRRRTRLRVLPRAPLVTAPRREDHVDVRQRPSPRANPVRYPPQTDTHHYPRLSA